MKKIFLFTIATVVALSSFAQRSKTSLIAKSVPSLGLVAGKTTATGDTVTYSHISFSTDTLTVYRVGVAGDSGIVTGTDAYGDHGFAERYDPTDTFVSVMGILAEFTGTVSPTSTKSVVFNAWSVGAKTVNSTYTSGHVYNSGLPVTSLASVTVPLTQLGIGSTATASDTAKSFWFTTPTAYVPSFFVGYTIAYTYATLAGDTVGVLCTKDGERHISTFSISGTDTTLNNVNVTMYADNLWYDNANDNFGLSNHLFLLPIVKLGTANGVHGITKNNLTFYGNYPNPATGATNIKFSLAQASEVTITITDMSGKVVKIINDKYNAGTQIVTLNTEAMAAGEYVYSVRTSEGDGFASKMAVIK